MYWIPWKCPEESMAECPGPGERLQGMIEGVTKERVAQMTRAFTTREEFAKEAVLRRDAGQGVCMCKCVEERWHVGG